MHKYKLVFIQYLKEFYGYSIYLIKSQIVKLDINTNGIEKIKVRKKGCVLN